MKNIKKYLLILFLFSSISFCQESQFDIRKANWGMNTYQVINSENNAPSDSITSTTGRSIIIYKSSINNISCDIGYIFIKNQLTRVKYIFNNEHSNKNEFIDDYKNIRELLIKKYGTPVKNETIWKNDLFKKDYDQWGTAISIGHLGYFSTWENNKTYIICYLNGDNYEIKFGIEYSSIKLKDLEDSISNKKVMDEL